MREWFYDKINEQAAKYNVFLDVLSRDNNGVIRAEDGHIEVKVQEVIEETGKAIQVRLSSGEVLGSYKGWKVWIPKSVIKK